MKDFMSPFLGFSPGTKISSIFLLAAVLFGAFCFAFLRGLFFGSGPLTGTCPANLRLFLTGALGFLAFGFFPPHREIADRPAVPFVRANEQKLLVDDLHLYLKHRQLF